MLTVIVVGLSIGMAVAFVDYWPPTRLVVGDWATNPEFWGPGDSEITTVVRA
jgi:hypothetical protein